MARTSSRFQQGDVSRALRAAAAAGLDVARYEIDPDGKIIVFTSNGVDLPNTADKDDLDLELDEWEAQHGES